MSSDSALDAYSQIVVGVAAGLTPRVASLRVPQEGSRGAQSQGSAVVFTPDGFLLTNAHVVGSADHGTALFSDGTSAPFTVVGADPLSDLAVLRADGGTPAARRAGRGRRAGGRAARGGGRQPARAGRVGHRRRGQRPRALAAHPQRRRRPHRRGRHPDRRRPQPGQLRRRPGRLPRARGRHQHRRGRGRPRAGRADERHQPPDHLRPDPRRPGPPGLPRRGLRPRPGAGRPAGAVRPRGGPAGRGGGASAARPREPDCTPATSCSARAAILSPARRISSG